MPGEWAEKFLTVYGPLGIGWVAYAYQAIVNRLERNRYHQLVNQIFDLQVKIVLAERLGNGSQAVS